MKGFLFLAMIFLAATPAFAQCNSSNNLALDQPAFASSIENGGTQAANAFDGNGSSRWSSGYSDAEYIYVDLGAIVPLCRVTLQWEGAYASNFRIEFSDDANTWTTASTVTGNTLLYNVIPVTGTARYVKMQGITRATGYGYSIFEFKVFGSNPTPICLTNLSQNKQVTASSEENGSFVAANAVDGLLSTRWSSAFSDPQFLMVDLGMVYPLCSVRLDWENAYGTAYRIELSNDANTWTTAASITGNASTVNIIPVSGNARYVRMYGLTRVGGYGYSLFEMRVFGTDLVLPLTWLSFEGVITNGTTRLNWRTAAEENNREFVIERKTATENSFRAIGTIPAMHSADGSAAYEWIDHSAAAGINAYRIRQVDYDGRITFSKTITVRHFSQQAGLRVFPNPVTSELTVVAGSESIDQLILYSAAGERLFQKSALAPGQQIQVDMGGQPAGVYLLQTISNSVIHSQKIIRR